MIPAKLDFTIYKGSTQAKPMQWKTGDPLTAVNLSGCAIQMQIRPKVDSLTVIDTLSTSNGRIVIDNAATGEFTLHFPADTTSGITDLFAVYDLEVVYPGGNPKYTIVEGKITFKQEVTRL